MNTANVFWTWPSLWALPNLDAPPPAPWGGHGMPPRRGETDEDDPRPEQDRPPVQEPWSGPLQPVREPGQATPRWRLH